MYNELLSFVVCLFVFFCFFDFTDGTDGMRTKDCLLNSRGRLAFFAPCALRERGCPMPLYDDDGRLNRLGDCVVTIQTPLLNTQLLHAVRPCCVL